MLLEWTNALVLSFILSELLLQPQFPSLCFSVSLKNFRGLRDSPRISLPFLFLICLNVFLCDVLPFALLHRFSGYVHSLSRVIVTPVLALGLQAGSALLLSLLVSLTIGTIIAGWRLRAHLPLYRWHFGIWFLFSVCLFLVLEFSRWRVDDNLLHHTHALKCLAVLTSFTLLCWGDVRRMMKNSYSYSRQGNNSHPMHAGTISLTYFLSELAMATAVLLPLLPFLAVFISFAFLCLVVIFERLGLPDAWASQPIYFGTLYGPFAAVYIQVKRECWKARFLLPS